MYTQIAAGLVESYPPPPRRIINNLNVDYRVKTHHVHVAL